MSKSKRARFHLKSGETILKKGMMDYCSTGAYSHFIPGDSVLTDTRFHFDAELGIGEPYSIDLPLTEIYAVEKIGIPFLTRSLRRRWYKPLKKAVEAARTKGQETAENE